MAFYNPFPMPNTTFAQAHLFGSPEYPNIFGTVSFSRNMTGVVVTANVFNLPTSNDLCEPRFFGFHLHEGSACTGTPTDPFSGAMGHYNPQACEHPEHAGDFPPLLNNKGIAYLEFVTGALNPAEIIGKTVIVHRNPDDFKTQPSGNSGEKIACGVVMAV